MQKYTRANYYHKVKCRLKSFRWDYVKNSKPGRIKGTLYFAYIMEPHVKSQVNFILEPMFGQMSKLTSTNSTESVFELTCTANCIAHYAPLARPHPPEKWFERHICPLVSASPPAECWTLLTGWAGLHLLSCAGQYFGQYSRQNFTKCYILGCIVLCDRY